jgi:hypothetical protein
MKFNFKINDRGRIIAFCDQYGGRILVLKSKILKKRLDFFMKFSILEQE